MNSHKLNFVSNIIVTAETKVILNYSPHNYPILTGDELQLLLVILDDHFLPLGKVKLNFFLQFLIFFVKDRDYAHQEVDAIYMSQYDSQNHFKYDKATMESFKKEQQMNKDVKNEKKEESEEISLSNSTIKLPDGLNKDDIDLMLKKIEKKEQRMVYDVFHGFLHLRRKFEIHSYSLNDSSIRLTLFTTESIEENQSNIDQFIQTVESYFVPFSAFVETQCHSHLAALKINFLERYPGLIHFMLVDRTNDILFAPQIVSLEYSSYNSPNLEMFQKICQELLQEIVCKLM